MFTRGYCHRDSQRQTFFQTFTIVSSIPSCPAPASLVSENIRYSYKQKNKLRDIRCTSKRMQQFVKFVRRLLIRTRATLLWFASGFVREATDTELRHLLANAPQFSERAAFSRQKARIVVLYKDGALRYGHQSAAHTMGEKRCTWHRAFTCRRGTFVAFFLTYTV